MNIDEELQDRLRRLARAVPREAGPAVERELRVKFRAQRKQRKRLWAYMAEAAAMLAAAAGLYFAVTHGRPAERREVAGEASGFIALPYGQSDVPMEQPVIVRVKISLSELSGLGMPLATAARGGNVVNADLLVGQDGVARAVRLVE